MKTFPQKDVHGPGRVEEGHLSCLVLLSVFFPFFFSFLSAAMTSATVTAICFCNCSSKASGKKAVLIVQITEQLITETVSSHLCNH